MDVSSFTLHSFRRSWDPDCQCGSPVSTEFTVSAQQPIHVQLQFPFISLIKYLQSEKTKEIFIFSIFSVGPSSFHSHYFIYIVCLLIARCIWLEDKCKYKIQNVYQWRRFNRRQAKALFRKKGIFANQWSFISSTRRDEEAKGTAETRGWEGIVWK